MVSIVYLALAMMALIALPRPQCSKSFGIYCVLFSIGFAAQLPPVALVIQLILAALFPLMLLHLTIKRIDWRVLAFPLGVTAVFASTGIFSVAPMTTLVKALAWGGLALVVFVGSSALQSAGATALALDAMRAGVAVVLWALVGSLLLGGGILSPESTGIAQLTVTILGMHPNTFALFITLGIVVLIARPTAQSRVLQGAGLASLVLLILASRSRTGMVLVLVIFGLHFVYRRGSRLGWVYFFAVVLVAGGFSPLSHVMVAFLLRGQGATQLSELSGRFPLWEAAYRAFLDAPWTGWGYGAGVQEAIVSHADIFLAYEVNTADSIVFDLLVAGGIGLLLIFAAYALALIRRVQTAGLVCTDGRFVVVSVLMTLLLRSAVGSGFDVVGPIAVLFHMLWWAVSIDRGSLSKHRASWPVTGRGV